MGLRVVIIEDEPAIARHLERLLKEINDQHEIIQVIDNVESGKQWFQENPGAFDLIFSDIQLLDGTSFEIFITAEPRKPIIFITAYEEYTLEAFNTNGIYYIIKPFQKEDIGKAIDKFELLTLKTDNPNGVDLSKLMPLMESWAKGNANYRKAYLVHFQNKLIPIKTEEIAWFYTENEVVYVSTFNAKKYILDTTLERLVSELSPVDFTRANRQFIINRAAIRDIDFYFNGRLVVNVNPPHQQKVIISKAKVSAFKKWLHSF